MSASAPEPTRLAVAPAVVPVVAVAPVAAGAAPGAVVTQVRWTSRFHVRLTAAHGAVVFGVLTAMAIVFYQSGYHAELTGLQGRLRATVATLALTADVPAIAALDPAGEPDAPAVRALYARFAEVARHDPEISTIYLLRKTADPDKLRFVVDFAARGKVGRPGELYDATSLPRMREGLTEVTVESQLWSDEFGSSLSGYAPLRLPSGESIGLIGVDVGAASVDAMSARVLTTTLALYGVAALLLALVAVWMGRRVRGPIAEIYAAAAHIAGGDFSRRVTTRRGDEFGMVARHFDVIAESLQERDFIRDTFGRYVSAEVARRVLGDRSKMALGGEERDATILFSDIAGYSTMSERVAPQEAIGVLNSYLGAMNAIIDAHEGVVIEFIGDAILCVFNTPNDVNAHAQTALRCALAMRERLVALNAEWEQTRIGEVWRESGRDGLRTRVGIHSGTVVAGNIGSPTRMKYGVLGDVVNVAARLEQMNKQFGTTILVSEATYARLDDALRAQGTARGAQVVRGREMSVEVYSF